jgi:hypothetical protein
MIASMQTLTIKVRRGEGVKFFKKVIVKIVPIIHVAMLHVVQL